MKRLRTVLLFIAVGGFPVVITAAIGLLADRSVVVIENRGVETIVLSVETSNPGQFSWVGGLKQGERVIRFGRFSDNSFDTVCRDGTGTHRSSGGYVTNGWPQRIDIVVDGCADVSVDVEMLP